MEGFVAVTFCHNVLPSVNFFHWKTILKGCKKMSMLMKSTVSDDLKGCIRVFVMSVEGMLFKLFCQFWNQI